LSIEKPISHNPLHIYKTDNYLDDMGGFLTGIQKVLISMH